MVGRKKIEKYCKYLRACNVEVVKKNCKQNTLRDLPACATICYVGKTNCCGYSHTARNVDWVPVIRSKQKTIENAKNSNSKLKYYKHCGSCKKTNGVVCKNRVVCKNHVGSCAEQHAGNSFLKKHAQYGLNDLYFTETLRPRTMEVILPCGNCKYIFPNL